VRKKGVLHRERNKERISVAGAGVDTLPHEMARDFYLNALLFVESSFVQGASSSFAHPILEESEYCQKSA
jgi:hypothetical protein